MKKIKVRFINNKTGKLFEEELVDAKVWARIEKEKKRSGLSWNKFIAKMLKFHKDNNQKQLN